MACIAAGLAVQFGAPLSRDVLFPAPGVQVLAITDANNGGDSWTKITPMVSGVRVSYKLGRKAKYPYAGLKLQVQADLQGAEVLEVGMKANPGVALRLALKSPAPELGRSNDPSAMFYHEVEYEPSGKDTLRQIPIREFRFPRWWRIREKWPSDQEIARLKDVREIEIMNGFEEATLDTVQAEIRSVTALVRPIWVSWVALSLMVAACVLFVFTFWTWRKERDGNKIESLKGSKPVELPLGQDLKSMVLANLKENYANPEYSLELLARGVGASERQASESLKAATGMHFKAVLNELRLSEAQRLLLMQTHSVSEIAYAVGFNNHAHFTRAFKAKYGKSPTEMRGEGNRDPA